MLNGKCQGEAAAKYGMLYFTAESTELEEFLASHLILIK